MNKPDWGNHDPARRPSEQPEQQQSKISYLKLYYTIVAAILTSVAILYLVSLAMLSLVVEHINRL